MEEYTGENEEREEKAMCCIKGDTETDSGTHMSLRPYKDYADKSGDKKIPVAMTNEVQRTEEPPSLVEKKRFMVYICGGYKGKNEQIIQVYGRYFSLTDCQVFIKLYLGSLFTLVLSLN